jgi:acetyltransferase-like isoleucine patch superfamily enzyme
MIRALITRLIQRVKHDPTYQPHPAIGTDDLVLELANRGTSLLRGLVKLAGVKGGRLRFVEPGTTIKFRRHLSVGNGSVIESGAKLRCLSRDGIVLGRRVTVGKYAIIECTGVLWHLGVGLRVGDDSSIGDYAFLGCGGGITIGDNVLMGQRVSFHSQNHNFDDVGTSIKAQGVNSKGIVVEDDCWLGSGAIILDGVTLGAGTIVAAGSVVTKSCGPNSILAGNPAKVLRVRGAGEAVPGSAGAGRDDA